ncbi:hypothetical protein PVK06_040143 [Gossypium arboreum]|uniref:Uncharacterized protein n=1 Tax=Gossypium arboreum TaxID=29729 RepID=A0ABR0N6V0_GOSAR|nr:hypothetical protein PVK06_040143 [Gossypium arboreum]
MAFNEAMASKSPDAPVQFPIIERSKTISQLQGSSIGVHSHLKFYKTREKEKWSKPEPKTLGKINQGEKSSRSPLKALEKENKFSLLGKEISAEPIINVNKLVNNSSQEKTVGNEKNITGHNRNKLEPSNKVGQTQVNNTDSVIMEASIGELKASDMESGAKASMNSGNFEGVKVHYNPTFKGLEGVEVSMTDGILDPRKHFAVIFKENLHSNQQGISVKQSMETLGVGTSGPKDRKNDGRDNINRGCRKPSNTLRGRESRFKSSGNF